MNKKSFEKLINLAVGAKVLGQELLSSRITEVLIDEVDIYHDTATSPPLIEEWVNRKANGTVPAEWVKTNHGDTYHLNSPGGLYDYLTEIVKF